MTEQARLKHFGWGREGEGLSASEEAFVLARAEKRFGTSLRESASAPRLDEITLPAPRVTAPAALPFATSGHYDRAAHAFGKSYPDLARGLARDYAGAPDVVAYPCNEQEIAAVLDWAGGADATVTPFGGGSSVCGGVEAKRGTHRGAVTVDLRHMGKVIEVDKTSRAALIEAGTYGPALEAQLKPHGLTLRHFPQSFEYSTLGGWIATRGGGHFATLYTHIDDFVESLRMVTPKGVIESRRLPGSGAGPSPDRMMIGSEGILGIITQAWMRRARCARLPRPASIRRTAASSIRPRPTTPARATARSPSWCSPSSPPTMTSSRG
jgi:alkyldihydroxyacetonephosphate synthase